MKPAAVVDYVDETRKVLDDIGEGFEGHRIDGLYFECLHEAFRFGVVVRITAAAHRADEALHHQSIAIELGSVLGGFKRSSQRTVCWLTVEVRQALLPAFSIRVSCAAAY